MGVWFSKFCAFVREHRVAAAIGFVCVAIAYIVRRKVSVRNLKSDDIVEALVHATEIGKKFYVQVQPVQPVCTVRARSD